MGLDELIDTTGGEEFKDGEGGKDKDGNKSKLERDYSSPPDNVIKSKDEDMCEGPRGPQPNQNENISRDSLYKICHRCGSVSIHTGGIFWKCQNDSCGIGQRMSWNEWYSDRVFLGEVNWVTVMDNLEMFDEIESIEDEVVP